MCKHLDYVRRVVIDNDIRPGWLAREMGIERHQLVYILHGACKELSASQYLDFMKVFDKHNYKSGSFAPIPATSLLREVCRLNYETAQLLETAVNAAQDHKITESETVALLEELDRLQITLKQVRETVNRGHL
jgi:hypothetical protein